MFRSPWIYDGFMNPTRFFSEIQHIQDPPPPVEDWNRSIEDVPVPLGALKKSEGEKIHGENVVSLCFLGADSCFFVWGGSELNWR